MQSITTLFTETFTDMFANPFSIFVFIFLLFIIFLLIIAIYNSSVRTKITSLGILEESETPLSLLKWILSLILIIKIIQAFIIQPFIVDGGSMLPTFHSGEFLIVEKLSYGLGKPQRGDVVVFKLYEQSTDGNNYQGKYLIKRIIGLPGESVLVQNGQTTITNSENPNGFILDESFVTHQDPNKNVQTSLDQDHYFVMGDNRAQSFDSRDWGPLESKNIRGQAMLRLTPLNLISIFPGGISN